jgi:hypothetical protein
VLGANQLGALLDLVHHRFLTIDRFACAQSIDRDLLMPVVGRADDDGVDVVTRENLPVVPRGEEVAPVALFRIGQPAVEAVGGGGELHTWHLQRRVHVGHSHAARTDHRQVYSIVGGLI